jgi:hypothetical protein
VPDDLSRRGRFERASVSAVRLINLANQIGLWRGKRGVTKERFNILTLSMWRGGRHRQPDLRPVSRRQRFAGHQFDCWPVLTEEARCVVEIARLHANTAGVSAGFVRYLKVKIEADCFGIFFDRLIISAHSGVPPFCVAHNRFTILIIVGRDCGALRTDAMSVDSDDVQSGCTSEGDLGLSPRRWPSPLGVHFCRLRFFQPDTRCRRPL